MFKLFITIVVLAVVLSMASSKRSKGGTVKCFPDAQCPSKGNILKQGLVPCATDCADQHGAKTGTCQANFCCKCGAPDGEKRAKSAQCRSDFKDANIKAGYENVCDIDCKCNHGAVGGTCNFEKHVCACGEDAKQKVCKLTQKGIQDILKKYKFPLNLLG